LNLGHASRTSERNTTRPQAIPPLRSSVSSDVNGINDGGGLDAAVSIPAPHDPVAGFPPIGHLYGNDPFRLFHPVHVRDVDTQGKAVLRQQRHTVPRIGQHHSRVLANGLERDDLEEAISGAYSEVRRLRTQRQLLQEALQADTRPTRRADELPAK